MRLGLTLLFMLPCGHRVSPSGEVGKPARRAISPFSCGIFEFTALRARKFRRPAKFGTPARRAISPFSCRIFEFTALWARKFRRPTKFGTPARRTARRGRLWGYAPSAAPLASPPEHPLREFSISVGWRGHASCAAGASFPRCARSGDLPPRRINARLRLRLG